MVRKTRRRKAKKRVRGGNKNTRCKECKLNYPVPNDKPGGFNNKFKPFNSCCIIDLDYEKKEDVEDSSSDKESSSVEASGPVEESIADKESSPDKESSAVEASGPIDESNIVLEIGSVKSGGSGKASELFVVPYDNELLIRTQIQKLLRAINKHKDHLIYLSVGGQYTEAKMPEYNIDSNAGYQMVPFFLCADSYPRINSANKNVICIAIDAFYENFGSDNTPATTSLNNIIATEYRNYLYFEQPCDNSNIKMFVINLLNIRNHVNPKRESKQLLNNYTNKLINIITEQVQQSNIDPKNYMMCNYVKFKREDNTFNITLRETLAEYNNSIYNWIGYEHSIFYNYLYKGTPVLFSVIQLLDRDSNNDIEFGLINNSLDDIFKEYLKKNKQLKPNQLNAIQRHFSNMFPIAFANLEMEFGLDNQNNFVNNLTTIRNRF